MNEDLNRLIQDVTDPQTRQAAIDLFNSVSQGGRNVEQALLAVRRTYVDLVTQSRDYTQSLIAATQAVQNTSVGLSQARKAQRSLVSISQKLQDNFASISDLSLKDLYTLRAKARQEKERLKDSAIAIMKEKELGDLSGETLRNKVQEEVTAGRLSQQQAEILNQYSENFQTVGDFIATINDAVKDQEELNRSLGLTGAALNNLNRIGVRALGGLGINLGTLEEDFKKAEQAAVDAVEEMRLAYARRGDDFDEQKAKAVAFRKALPGVGKALGTALVDPLTIGLFTTTKLVAAFKEINQAQTDFRRLTGRSGDTFAQLTSNAANAVEVLQVSSELTRQIGMNAEEVFGPETLLQITEAKNLLGLSAEEAGRIALFSKLTNQTTNLFQKGIEEGAKSSNRLFKSGVSTKIALEDALSASEGIALSLGMSGERLGEAAVAARALGVELSEVDAIANSLLNFETSIENELQAQLLTGRQLNLVRARELALNNDLAGVAREVTQNIVTGAEFADMNRIAQEGLASAIGVSRDQLARMIIQQDLNNSLTQQQRANMMGLTLEQYQAQTAAESLRRSFQGIAQSIVGIVEPFVTFIAENEKLLKILLASAAVIKGISIGMKGLAAIQGTLLALEVARNTASERGLVLQTASIAKGYIEMAQESAIAAFSLLSNPAKIGVGLAAIAAGVLAVKGVQKMFSADDAVVDPKGGLVVSEPAGTFGVQLNPKDQLIAGTDLNKASGPSQTNNSNEGMMRKLDELISAVKTGGNVYLDGNKVGESLVLSSVKSS